MFQTDPFSLIVLLVGLSLLPFIAMIATSYLKIVVVISLIRNALGIQSIPPNMVVNAMAMILSFYIMAPICSEAWSIAKTELAGKPAGAYETQAVAKAADPFREFLVQQTDDRQRAFFVTTAEHLWSKDGEPANVDPESFAILLPSFCVSELTKAFQIGFLVYLPFIAIDIIVSNILLAMGMMMVSPVTISLPFKLLLFVMVDGWTLLIQGLVRGYAT
ncbi:MAG: type III secretion system export apparatus subunit SctR [Kiritimatiellae bacterium]|nr:type III secretion system export apparatus subunit SctR [Kiritimatiellia bacterium]